LGVYQDLKCAGGRMIAEIADSSHGTFWLRYRDGCGAS
jgi:hypothetical protein